MNPVTQHHEIVANKLIEQLKRRHMEGYYCKSKEEAMDLVNTLVTEGSTVSFGGSMTITETGILPMLKERDDITMLDRSTATSPEEIGEIYRKAFSCDTYLMSTNAITKSGELLNIDGTGNRVAALIFGPKEVLVIAGMNKVCEDMEDAMKRVRNIASPPNCVRLNKKTPCSVTGSCGECLSDDCICNQIVVTRNSRDVGRIKVILVEGDWGY